MTGGRTARAATRRAISYFPARASRCQHGAVTYFADLSPYSYGLGGRHDHLVEQPDAVNVGWLGAGHEFPAGQAPGWLVPGILKLVAGGRVNQMRGYHVCDLCQFSQPTGPAI
jgi:hypothetical protein